MSFSNNTISHNTLHKPHITVESIIYKPRFDPLNKQFYQGTLKKHQQHLKDGYLQSDLIMYGDQTTKIGDKDYRFILIQTKNTPKTIKTLRRIILTEQLK